MPGGQRNRFYQRAESETKETSQQQQLIEEIPQELLEREYLLFSFKDTHNCIYSVLSSGRYIIQSAEGDIKFYPSVSDGPSREIEAAGRASVKISSDSCQIVEGEGTMYKINYHPPSYFCVDDAREVFSLEPGTVGLLVVDESKLESLAVFMRTEDESFTSKQEMLERQGHIEEISRNMHEIHGMFGDTASLIAGQQGFVDQIEKNVDGARQLTRDGVEHLTRAENISKVDLSSPGDLFEARFGELLEGDLVEVEDEMKANQQAKARKKRSEEKRESLGMFKNSSPEEKEAKEEKGESKSSNCLIS